MGLELVNEYISHVTNNPDLHCKWVKLSVKRHLLDLKRSDIIFDKEEAAKSIKFIKLLRHTKGKGFKGKRFNLLPFQAFIVASICGWKNSDGFRRFRTAYNKISRKNAKTELGAALSLYLWWSDRDGAPEIHVAATKREQAAIGFDAIRVMATYLAKESKKFRNAVVISQSEYKKKIYLKGGGFIQTLGRDSKNEDGFFPSVGFIDEYHAHPTNQMIDILETGFGLREQPLTLIITTAGVNRHYPCAKFEVNVCQKVLEGVLVDDTLFCIMFDIDEGDEWDDEKNWGKANPLAVTIPAMLKTLKIQADKAAKYGAEKLNSFLTKNLNVWTNSHSAWFPIEKWNKNFEKVDLEKLKGRRCFGGLDLASTRDINALVLFFPRRHLKEKHVILCKFFIPGINAEDRTKNDKVNYTEWAKDDFLILTGGNATDYDVIEEAILEAYSLYQLESIGYDIYNSSQLIINLNKQGIDEKIMNYVPQTLKQLSPGTKELERMVAEEELNHLLNPVLAWMFSNIALYSDGNDRIKIDKAKSNEKVDGMVALVMAISEWMDWALENKGRSIYDILAENEESEVKTVVKGRKSIYDTLAEQTNE